VSALFRSTSTTAFDKLYRRHAAAVYRYARAVLGNHADAEDVAQQTFLNAYRALARGTKPRKAENWLFTIAHNEVRRHLRDTRGRRLEVELDEQLAHTTPERSEPSVTDVLRALQSLTPNQRSALVMREFEGRPYAEIAEIMGVTQTALETLIFRARRALAEALEDGLTCAEAELAVSQRLDGRLSRRDARRLRAHMRECRLCMSFERRQKRQRTLLKGLSVIPVPASLFFRGEQAVAAVGGGATVGGAIAGGSAGIAAKAAAVAAVVTVAGGVGYTAGADPVTVRDPQARVAQSAASGRTPAASPVPRQTVSSAPALTRRSSASSPKRHERKAPTTAVHGPRKVKAPAAPARARKAGKVTENPKRVDRATPPVKVKPTKARSVPVKAQPEKTPKRPKLVRRKPATPSKPGQPKRANGEPRLPASPPGRKKHMPRPNPQKATASEEEPKQPGRARPGATARGLDASLDRLRVPLDVTAPPERPQHQHDRQKADHDVHDRQHDLHADAEAQQS
jgi:RNA polymerase sigma factor (sigma-70 family)